MPKINILPKSVAELIAAGEVVERPSSVVKELIENSVDAGAKNIIIEIKNGGTTYIRVTDDGCGIAQEDVQTAFISHATSKIKTGEDLNSIFTLGFRGEALASAAAVARVELMTKTADENCGTLFRIEGGEASEQKECGCPDGTTITVRDLFYNTPARMKFLKKDVTEGNYVSDTVIRIALSHPEISFRLIRDSKQTIFTDGNGKLEDTVYSLFGKEFAEGMISGKSEIDGLSVTGLISKPLCGRANRNMQYFFVNGRFVKIPFACSALDQAYKNKIMVGKFPSCILFINIPAQIIDVNVHPAKTEIRFSSEKPVFEAVYYAAVNALARGDTNKTLSVHARRDDVTRHSNGYSGEQLDFARKAAWGESVNTVSEMPSVRILNSPPVIERHVTPRNPAVDINITKNESFESSGTRIFRDDKSIFDRAEIENNSFVKRVTDVISAKNGDANPVLQPHNSQETDIIYAENPKEDFSHLRFVGEVFKTFIILENSGKLYIIDKHAAHERILFNKLKKRADSEGSQVLLSPVSVRLNMKEYDAVINNLDTFAAAGYSVEDFGDGCVLVRECPMELGEADPGAIITELAGELLKGNLSLLPERIDWLYHSTACKAAVKSGDSVNEHELLALSREVLLSDDVRYCPHGRPVLIEISEYELEKQFGRLG